MIKAIVLLNIFYFFHILTVGTFNFRKRYDAIKNREMSVFYFKSYTGEVPESVQILGNHYNNQFQAPILFMIVCLFAITLKALSWWFVAVATLFVYTRLAHTYIHLTKNNIRMRALTYFIGLICIGCMWIMIFMNTKFEALAVAS